MAFRLATGAQSRAKDRCGPLQTRHELNRSGQRSSLLQGIWQGNFSGSRVTATIPAGLVQLRQRVAANSLRQRGREFVGPAQGNVSRLAGNSQARAGNRRRNPDANISCRSSSGRSFVDGANFDGRMDNVPELGFTSFGRPAVLCPRVFCAGLHSGKTKLSPDLIRPHQPHVLSRRRLRNPDFPALTFNPRQGRLR
jgi:hypothetical protein